MKHLKKILISVIILLAFAGSANAAGTEVQTEIEILTEDQIKGQERAPPVNDVIRQGETNRHTYTPEIGQKLEVSLIWNRASSGNDLDLCIYPPQTDPIQLHDEIDGKTDGKISLRIPLTSSYLNQLWVFDVAGAQVSGTQSYTLIINSY